MRCYLVLKPTETSSAQTVEMYAVKLIEHYEKKFLSELPIPKIAGDSDEPENKFLDGRMIGEVFDIVGYVGTKAEVDNLRTNFRTWCDSDSGKPSAGDKQGAAIDVWLTSNYQTGTVKAPVIKTTYPDDGSTTVWTSAPKTTYLHWRFGETNKSGGGFLTRLRITWEPEDDDATSDYSARWYIEIGMKRGIRLG